MFAYFSPFLTYSSKKRIAKNASIQQYYKELSSLLCCDNKSKKKFLHDFIFQIDEFAKNRCAFPALKIFSASLHVTILLIYYSTTLLLY